jgi:lipoprotein-releasing system permease protein
MSAYWYEGFIGRRYLRASRRHGFLSFISGIAVVGLALGVAVLIVVLSVMNGFESELRTRILSLTAHATVSGLEGRIGDWQVKLTKAASVAGVTAVAPYLEQQGMMVHGERSAGVLVRGIDPRAEAAVEDLSRQLLSGRLSDLVPGQYHAILGNALAETLGVKQGDKVVLVIAEGNVTPIGVLPRMRSFLVSGIVSAGMYEYDKRLVLVALPDAQKLYQFGADVTGLRLSLEDMYQAPGLVRQVALALGGGFYVEDWTRRHANFFRSIEITKRILFVILSLVVGVAAFNVVSTLVMVVKDKRREVAILRTMGAAPRSIMTIFVVQGSLIGLLGIAAGVVLGVLLSVNLQNLVHGLEALLGTHFLDARVYFMSDLPARVRLSDVLQVSSVALLLSIFSTVYPAWRASRLQPAESLRND